MRADLTLALDLESTLITNAVSQFPRPGLHEFLEWTRTAFGRVVLFTAVPPDRVRQILGNLVSQGEAPAWTLDLEVLNPIPLTVPWGPEPVSKKDLRVLGNPARVFLVDDHEGYVVHEQRGRWVPVAEFTGDPQDRELTRVREELERRLGGTVPVSEDIYGEPCVLFKDIPARALESFDRFILGAACPKARPGDGHACYVHDYKSWLRREGAAFLPEAGLREEGGREKEDLGMERIMVLGDVHGDFARVNALIAQQRPDLILQCGDWGFWLGAGMRNPLKLQGATVRWCRGNHEDHFLLRAALDGRREATELSPGVIHQPDGSTLTLPDGRVVVFLGGSASVDWKLRVMGKNWFPEEVLEPDVLDRLPARADIVVSHTLPMACFMASGLHLEGAEREALELRTGWDLSPDPSQEVLEEARKRLRPTLWYASHFHKLLEGELDGCAWIALDQISGGDAAWRWLPKAGRAGGRRKAEMHHEEHCRRSLELFGERHEAVHAFLDQYATRFPGLAHRLLLHHALGVDLAVATLGEEARRPAEQHILDDLGRVPAEPDLGLLRLAWRPEDLAQVRAILAELRRLFGRDFGQEA